MKDFLIYIGQHFFPSKISVTVSDDGTWKIPLEDRIITLSYDGKIVAKTRKRRNVDAVPRPSGMRKTIKQDVDPEEVLRLLGKRISAVEVSKPTTKPAAKPAPKQRKTTAVPKSARKVAKLAKPTPKQKVAAEQKSARKPRKKFAEGSVVSTKYAPNVTYTVVSQKDNIVVVFEKSTNITREVALSDLV